MFYRPEDGHGLPHSPFNAIVAPRPIGWISSRGADGVNNLAPYSFFNAVAYVPPQVMFASNGDKDSVSNIRDTGVFCTNVVAHDMRHVMNATSATLPPDIDEFDHAGVERVECETIPCARVAGAPASMECRATRIVQLDGPDNFVVFGEVTGVHIREDCLNEGLFDVTRFNPVSRLGYRDYATVRDVFTLARPDD